MYNIDEMHVRYGDLFVRELELERSYKDEAAQAIRAAYEDVANSTLKEKQASNTAVGQRYIALQWKAAYDGITVFVEKFLAPKCGVKASYVDLLRLIDKTYAEHYAAMDEKSKHKLKGTPREAMINLFTIVTFTSVLSGVMKHHSDKSSLAQVIASEIGSEVKTLAYMADAAKYPDKFDEHIKERVRPSFKKRYVEACMKRAEYKFIGWDKKEAQQLATSLIEVLLASTSYFEVTQVNNLAELIPTQEFMEGWQKSTNWMVLNGFKYCPTIIPPRPWVNNVDGGYYGELIEHTTMLRLHKSNDIYSKSYSQKLGQLELTNVRKAVNAIQATPWVINTKVLEVLQEIMKRGGGLAGIPSLKDEKPAVLPENPTEKQIQEYKKVMIRYYKNKTRTESLLLRINNHLRTAKKFKEFDRFYFPCNMDFRGRIYPVPSFNFQGDDVNKSLILFADPPACQDMNCWNWMLIEGANLAGVDKVSFDDRIKWVLDHEEAILKVADDPFADLWWADDSVIDCPCQFLAWCFEYKRMKQHITMTGGIEGFVTGLNVAFDGTCSGLQHFSAILRDPIGGQAVNLVPGDKPSDIYGIVAAKVNKVLEQDMLKGTEDTLEVDKEGNEYTKHGTRFLSSVWIAYGVTRKVTKRSVMTLAYGSKEYGFRDQLLEDIIKPDKIKNGEKSVFEGCDFQAAGYLAKLIWNAVKSTVVAAVDGMKWLQECARKVTKNNQVVSWMTPMGLPVQQAYMVTKSVRIFTRCAGKQIRIYDNVSTGQIDNRKQASGVAPNFIHSMDAAHLQLTICNCCDMGIKHFAMIHDSYGAPLAQAQLMFDTVRKSFIQMYTEHDVFAEFRSDLEALADDELPQPPKKGTLDINCVRESLYVFS